MATTNGRGAVGSDDPTIGPFVEEEHLATRQYMTLGFVALAVVTLTIIQVSRDRSVFEPFIGDLNPVGVMVVVAALAFPALWYLSERTPIQIFILEDAARGLVFSLKVVPVLAMAAIAADLLLRFPEDMNVAMPDALAFYPAIGFLVEVCLHAVPLALLVAVFLKGDGLSDSTFWLMATAVVLLEAGFQAAFASSAGTAVFSGLHLMVFGFVQMYVFRRFGFISMFNFRILYYVLWHLAWGSLRGDLLF